MAMIDPDAQKKPFAYAPVLALVFLLWPLMGILGGQGYSPLLLIAGLPALAVARPRTSLPVYTLLGFAFVAWAAVTEFWSPASTGFVSGNPFKGNFAIEAASVRIIATAILAALAVRASIAMKMGSSQISARLMIFAFAFQGLFVILSSYLAGPFIEAIYGPDPLDQINGVQNVARNANAFLIALPILLGYLGARQGWPWIGVCALIIIASLTAFMRVDSQAAMIGTITMLFAMAVVHFAPRNGFRWLLGGLAAYIALAPALIGGALAILRQTGITLPGSFQSRAWSWERVIEKTFEQPFFGNGISASKTWRETYSSHPEWLANLPPHWAEYPVIPGHPHNMPLQIWAETGLVGAMLVSWALAVLALSLRPPADMRKDIRYAAAGLIGVVTSLMSVAYSVWNEAFWASIVLAVCGLILLARRQRGSAL